jgi:D-cysteine desulfhydrase
MEELLAQGCHSQWIVIATSSGGTQAGLLVGARHFGYGGKIIGISVDEKADVLKPKIADLASQTAAFLGLDIKFSSEEVFVNDQFLGGGYGVMGNDEKEAILNFARQDGIFLDPVYTGRAAAGMLQLAKEGFFGKNQSILFWHTGGLPSLFAEPYRNNLIN